MTTERLMRRVAQMRKKRRLSTLADTAFASLAPFGYDYNLKRAEIISQALGAVASGARLDASGVLGDPRLFGSDERLIEYAWVADALLHARSRGGRLLDVGCVLNYGFAVDAVTRAADEQWFLNIEYEPLAFKGRCSFLACDVRDVPLPRQMFDVITCISTLEHVGMDNRRFSPQSGRDTLEGDVRERTLTAITEMQRLLRPGGTLLLTVPAGAPQDMDWQQIYGLRELERTQELLGPRTELEVFFSHPDRGWVREPPDSWTGLQYGVGVAAAWAVACFRYTAPS